MCLGAWGEHGSNTGIFFSYKNLISNAMAKPRPPNHSTIKIYWLGGLTLGNVCFLIRI